MVAYHHYDAIHLQRCLVQITSLESKSTKERSIQRQCRLKTKQKFPKFLVGENSKMKGKYSNVNKIPSYPAFFPFKIETRTEENYENISEPVP